MRHGTSNANGHGMPCDEGFPISAASKDTVGRIPPTCQHLMLRVSSGEGSSLFCTLLFPKNLDRTKLWSSSYLHFRYPNRSQYGHCSALPLNLFASTLVLAMIRACPADLVVEVWARSLLSSRPPASPGARSETQPFLESGDPSRFSLFIQRGSASVAHLSRLDLRQNR